MKFITESGSIYEVNVEQKQIRRVTNMNGSEATGRQGNNEWRTYDQLSEIVVGHPVAICWSKATTPLMPGSPDFMLPGTLTSPVQMIMDTVH